MPEAESKMRNYKRSDYSVFQDALRRLPNTTKNQLCDAIGYSSTAWASWEKDGKMPMPAAIACEAVVRRHQQADTRRYFLVTVDRAGLKIKEVTLTEATIFNKTLQIVEELK